MTRRQRRALMLLGTANLIALSTLVLLLLQTPSPKSDTKSPLNPQSLETCRQQVSRALLDAGQTGLVQTRQDGTILLQLQPPPENPNRSTTTETLRLEADAITWTALEAVAVASQGRCLDFDTIKIIVLFHPSDSSPLRATARVALADLLLWSLGEIDDAELTLRLEYQPPTLPP